MGIFDLTWSSVNSWRICLGIWLETWVSTGDFTNYGDITWEIYNYKQLDMSELFGDWICYFDHHLERFMMRYTGRIVYKWVYNRLQLACLKLGCIPRSNHLNGNCWLITEFWCALFSDKAMYCGYVLYIIVYLSNHILGICVYHGIIMGYILGKYDGDILGIALWNVVRSNFFRKIMRCLYSIGIWIIEVKETCLPCCSMLFPLLMLNFWQIILPQSTDIWLGTTMFSRFSRILSKECPRRITGWMAEMWPSSKHHSTKIAMEDHGSHGHA